MAHVAAIASTAHYGGFWRRFLALIIDSIILSAVFWAISLVVPLVDTRSLTTGDDGVNFDMHLSPIGTIITFGGSWLYFALLESSRGATIGKMALSMQVVKPVRPECRSRSARPAAHRCRSRPMSL